MGHMMLPDVAVTSVFFGQCHGIGHMADTGIVGGQYELGLFFLIRDFTKRTLHSGNVLHSSFDTLFRVLLFARRHSHGTCRSRHQLHQPLGPGP